MSEVHENERSERAQAAFAALAQLAGIRDDDAYWSRFAACAAEFCRSPVCQIYGRIEGGIEPVVVHPSSQDPAAVKWISARVAALQAKLDRRAFAFEPVSAGEWAGQTKPFLLVVKLDAAANRSAAFVADYAEVDRFHEVVVRAQLLAAVAAARNCPLAVSGPATAPLAGLLETLDEVYAQSRFWPAAMTLVDAVVVRFRASRVSLGWTKNNLVRAVAISGLERFDPNTESVVQLEQLFEECVDHETRLIVPATRAEPPRRLRHHERFLASKSLTQLVSIPILVAGQPRGVIVIESSDTPVGEVALDEIGLTGQMAANWLQTLYRQDRSWAVRAQESLRDMTAGWLGPRHTLAKFMAVVVTGFIVAASLIKIDFNLDATATLETDQVSFLTAPFNGYVDAVKAESGEAVLAGAAVLELNREELELRELEEIANLQRFKSEVEKARSARDLVDMKVAQARVQQAETELARTRYYLSRSTLVAKFSGIVVEGERRQLLGAPVSKGDVLMKIADPSVLFVRIKLNERDIDFVTVGSKGELKLLSQPGEIHGFEITRVVPAAEVDAAEGNVFWLRAQLVKGQQAWWRPGMSGTVEIAAGKKSILGVWFHRTWDAIRMRFWW